MMPIYLDYNASAPLRDEVAEAVSPFTRDFRGNPSSAHQFGFQARAAIDLARLRCAALIGASPEEIVFTSGGTEANNQAILGIMSESPPGARLLASPIEHSSVEMVVQHLAAHGTVIDRLPLDSSGVVPESALAADKIAPGTRLVCLMLANNETGAAQPIAAAARAAAATGALCHCDAVQALGKIPINVKDLGVDTMSFSAHKIYGPQGVGALYVRRGLRLPPLLRGGGQEFRLRAGTENVAGIVGFGVACELAGKEMAWRPEEDRRRRDMLLELIIGGLGGADGLLVVSPTVSGGARVDECRCLPNTLNISFRGVAAEALAVRLDLAGVCVSTAAACANAAGVSRVLKAMNLPPEFLRGAIRISIGLGISDDDIHAAANIIAPTVRSMQTRVG